MARVTWLLLIAAALLIAGPSAVLAAGGESPRDIVYAPTPPAPDKQLPEEAERKSAGCKSCHTKSDEATMHINPAVVLGCVDCHGGDATVVAPPAQAHDMPAYVAAKNKAHVQPRYPETWHHPSSATPPRTYTLLNRESREYVRFVNPSDYRVAKDACGACHLPIIEAATRSLMANAGMFWAAAAYNNGILPFKVPVLGEGYTTDGQPAQITSPLPVDEKMKKRGILPVLYPMPAWEVLPPGDIFRVFERGGRNILTQFAEVGLPNPTGLIQRLEEPGRPDIRQSMRGPATGLRIAVPIINVTKTRLNDPFTWFMGTNDQPGDFRTSGCGACHIVYANDRNPLHSGQYARFGHTGRSQTADPTIPRDEQAHPLKHEFTRAIPSSMCMICHMHQPNIFLNTYYGTTMWDYESDAGPMWPETQKYASIAEEHKTLERNPERAAVHGKWSDIEFVENVAALNPLLKDTQFADYHGHGWNFREIQKRDRKGNLLDAEGRVVANDDPMKWQKTVHMSSIHLDAGMHCMDCHFSQDAHGSGYIHGEVQGAIEITCKDCHGTATAYPSLRTTGPAAPPGGRDITWIRNADGARRFEWRGNKLIQRSAVNPGLEWEMTLVKDTVDPASPKYNEKAARAKLMSKGTSFQWGPGVDPKDFAHKDEEIACFTCHTSWTTSCAGCHLPIEANWKTERHKYEGGETRNYATYNPQVARDEMFQLGKHSTIKNGIIAPIASRSALILSSTNVNRERIYIQQPPISAAGFSSQAFSPHFPHTARKTETKTCTDCHLSDKNDNNAIMAQLLLHGTNFVNFVGFNAWVGLDGGFESVQVTEWEEPQAVIGSFLHSKAYPDWYREHQQRGKELPDTLAFGAFGHGSNKTGCITLRGEYLYVAEGTGGFRVYDAASIANKGISQRIITAPFGPWGHDTHVATKNATCVMLPTNQPINPAKNQGELMRVTNQEQPFHPIYTYAFVTDAEEGLIAVNIDTMIDGEPRNNFLKRAVTWNENNVLKGARHITIAGYYFYITADAGIVVVNMDDPLKPKLETVLPLQDARATALQFRYLFATDREGLKVFDATDLGRPRPVAAVPLADAHRLYLARTYAYVAGGREGLVIVDIENPEKPWIYTKYTADGKLNDARDVIVGSTNASLYAYVADGVNGLKVLQLTGPDIQPNFYGFSPEPKPTLISWRKTGAPALSLSKGLDRDRAVDETGGQIAIFGRIGSRPFNFEEQRRFYLKDGKPWFVTDEVRKQDFVPPPGQSRPRAAAPGARETNLAEESRPAR